MINNTCANGKNKSRAVTFSASSELYIVPELREQGISTTWYSSQDKRDFRRSMVASIQQVTREIEGLPVGVPMTQDQLVNCLGIESFISKGAARTAAQARRAHIDAVLSEQCLQKQNGTIDVERISIISQMGSRWTTERARKLATGYYALNME